jgi:hypothetical protein
MYKGSLIRSGGDAKTTKGNGIYETAIMYIAPSTISGTNVCPMAETAGCIAGCLYTAGRGAYNNVQAARIAKAKRFHHDRKAFMAELVTDITKFVRYCERKGVKPAIRLNGTSDIAWELIPCEVQHCYMVCYRNVMEAFPEVQFYDYTKVAKRVTKALPENYSLTLSHSDASMRYATMVWDAARTSGANVAVVFRDKATRERYMATGMEGREVIDGDRDDLRFLDPKGVVVGLYAKGQAKGDTSGFVVD